MTGAAKRGGKPVVEFYGQRIGKLLVCDRADRPAGGGHRASGTGAWWLVACDCGRYEPIYGERLKRGRIRFCSAPEHRLRRR